MCELNVCVTLDTSLQVLLENFENWQNSETRNLRCFVLTVLQYCRCIKLLFGVRVPCSKLDAGRLIMYAVNDLACNFVSVSLHSCTDCRLQSAVRIVDLALCRLLLAFLRRGPSVPGDLLYSVPRFISRTIFAYWCSFAYHPSCLQFLAWKRFATSLVVWWQNDFGLYYVQYSLDGIDLYFF